MPSSYIRRRLTRGGEARFDVCFRVGGREAPIRHAGTFRTRRDAEARRRWVDGELAAMRVPDVGALAREPERAPTVASAAAVWRESRLDVAEGTRVLHRVALGRILPHLGERRIDELTAADVAAWVVWAASQARSGRGYSRGTIHKSLTALRMVLDHHGIEPNPARDRRVRLPREDRPEIQPPSADHVEAVLGACAPRYVLPLLVLEATGMRVAELETLTWGDVDEAEGRWRVSRAVEKTRRGRWVQVPADLFAAVLALRPREDRDPGALVFEGVSQARLRTDIARACRATGTPLWSPHDLRHRRISLWHRDGVPWADIGQRVGQRNLAVTANTYSHTITEGEIRRGAFMR